MYAHKTRIKTVFVNVTILCLGLAVGCAYGLGNRQKPAEHEGVS